MTRQEEGLSHPGDIGGIDPIRLTTWMTSLSIAFDRPLRLRKWGGGHSNVTVLVSDAAGRRWVLRRPPLGPVLESAHDVSREATVLAALRPTPVPVPDVLGVSTDVCRDGVTAMLVQHVEGAVMDSVEAVAALGSASKRALGLGMADTLAGLHAVDVDHAGLASWASTRPFAGRQLRRWTAQWELSQTRDQPLVRKIAQRLARAAPRERERVVVHGDYHLWNVIVAPTDGRINAILDWELSTLGDPLADVGMMLAYWPKPDDPAGAVMRYVAGMPTRAELLNRYARSSGRDVSSVGYWHVLSLWKIAVITEGVRRRRMDDPWYAKHGAIPPAAEVDAVLEEAMAAAAAIGI